MIRKFLAALTILCLLFVVGGAYCAEAVGDDNTSNDGCVNAAAWTIIIIILGGIFYAIRLTWKILKWLLRLLIGGTTNQEQPKPVVPQAIDQQVEKLDRHLRSMDNYLQRDPGFDEEDVKMLITEFFVKKHDELQNKSLNEVRPYLDIILQGWRVSRGRDYITAILTSRLGELGELVSYKVGLSRKSGVTTPMKKLNSQTSVCCPHCGAPLNPDKLEKCEYCGSILKVDKVEWTITNIKPL